MAVSKATLKYLIGINSDICSNVFYFDEETIFYPCGCYCVFFNTQQKNMRLLIASEKGTEITAMAICPSRNYSAVALNSEKPSINVLDLLTLQKSKTLVCRELHSCKIVSLSFSSNSRYIVALCDDPSRTLLYWSWKRSKLLLSTKVVVSLVPETLYHVSFNPQTHFNVYIFGNRFLRLFRFEGNKYKQFNFPKIVPQDFKCYCWDVNERLLVGTGSGRVLFIEDTDLKLDFNVFQHSTICNESVISNGITAIASYSKGFITACGTKYVQFFERVEIKNTYEFVRNVWFPSNVLENSDLCDQIIKWMVVNPSEDVLVISTNMKQLYSTQVYPPETKHMNQMIGFDVLVHPFHYKSITGCCVCLWKPLIATSSLDGSIKLWNYETFTLELFKNFSEEVYSISMHPMGLFLLAGFNNKLRFMYILRNNFKPFKDINIRSCTHCNFSRGGHMFAAVSNNNIEVYSSITFERLVKLKGHDGKIQTTAWCKNDNYLFSCDLAGEVYKWELKTGKQIGQCVIKSCAYKDLTINVDNKKLYAVGSDYSLKEIYESNILQTFQSGDVLFTSVALSWSNTMLFVGTNNGHIRSLDYPMVSGKYFDYPCHSLETTHMTFTSDDRYLISISRDFSIAIWNFTDSESRNFNRKLCSMWPEEILIPVEELKQKKCLISNLKSRVETLMSENKYQLHLRDIRYGDKIKETSDNYNQEKENLIIENEILENNIISEKDKYDEQMAEIIDEHCKNVEFLNATNDKKLLEESEKFKNLSNRLVALHDEQEQTLQDMIEKQELIEEKLTERYEKIIENLENEIDKEQDDICIQETEHGIMEERINKDVEIEFVNIQTEYEKHLYVERYANSETKGKNDILKKTLLAFPKELKESEDECLKYKLEVKKLNIVKNNLEKDIILLKDELEVQFKGLSDEEKRFCDLKLKNHDIELLKCEQEYKNTMELRCQIEMRETSIDNMKKQISAMQTELEHFTVQFIVMDHTIAETKEKLAATSQELDKVRTVLRKKTTLLDRFCADLINCTSFIREPQKLKNSIKSLYEKYIEKNDDKIVITDPNIQVEWGRQRNHFEYTIHKLKYQLNQTTTQVSRETHHLVNKTNFIGETLQITRSKNSRLLAILEGAK